ncbi:MAG: flagellar motor stator protein MotA [Vicinamibacterales bacterium]|nr:flagellar motor stator protein MotA [Vicinamibacterales bacterium]
MLVIVGSVIVVVAVGGGYLMHGGVLGVLWQPSEVIIICGSALGALLIATPVAVIKRIFGQSAAMLKGGFTKNDYLELLGLQYQLFKLVQQSGVMALEAHFDDPAKSTILSRYPNFLSRHHALDFLADSVKVIIIGGISAFDLESLMDEDIEVHHHEELKPSSALRGTADALPGLGIVAAVLGIVITMGAIDGPPAEIGHKVAAALVGTFLGIFLCYGFVGPMATAMESRIGDDGRYIQCIKTGLLAVYKGFPPSIAVEFARRVLPSDVRPSFDATEEFCKALGKADQAQVAEAA